MGMLYFHRITVSETYRCIVEMHEMHMIFKQPKIKVVHMGVKWHASLLS